MFPVKFKNFKIVLADEAEHGPAVETLLRTDYIPNFEIVKAVQIELSPVAYEHTANLASHCIKEGLSVVGIDEESGAVVGAKLSAIANAEDGSLNEWIAEMLAEQDEALARLYRMFSKIDGEFDVFKKYGVSRLLDHKLLSVHSNFTNRGLATKMLEVDLEYAKSKGLTLVRGFFVGPMSQRVAEKNGFSTLKEVFLQEFRMNPDDEKVFFPEATKNVSIKYMVKELK